MVPWGTGDPISSGDLNTLVFLTEKPPPLSVSVGGGSMSQSVIRVLKQRIRSDISHRSDIKNRPAVCHRICQSIGLYPFDMRKSLVLENGLEPKNPL